MDKRLADLHERLRNGEAQIAKLPAGDPKRNIINDRLNKLRHQIADLGSSGASMVTEHVKQSETPLPLRDPRPDLTEDSHLWTALLELTDEYDEELSSILNGFRCGGTRLKFGDSRWVLRPDVGPGGWRSLDEYNEAKEKYLKDWFGVLLALLDELTRRKAH
jgi:hypothetical protein